MEQVELLQAKIEEVAREWAEQFVAQRKSHFDAKKINASGALRESLQTDTIREASSEIIATLIEFEEHGRFLDMKKLKPSTQFGDLYLKELEDWLLKTGFFQKFRKKYEDKYESKRKFKRITSRATQEQRALSRMAWGIAVNRSRGKYRRRSWYNKPKSASLTDLFNRVAANIPQIAADEIAKQFS